jgi:hypothetical protein
MLRRCTSILIYVVQSKLAGAVDVEVRFRVIGRSDSRSRDLLVAV